MIKIRYAKIRSMDISNGEGIGISLFTQGCRFHCKNCFNTETWDFNGGKEWSEEVKKDFLRLAADPHIKRISLLGGEPLADENLNGVLELINEIRLSFPQKNIWLYSGFTWEEVFNGYSEIRKEIISKCDVMIDGRYVDELRDISLKWKGSTNQNVIDVQESIKHERLVLYCN
ncbi:MULTISPECIES: anaerobic ribonucleoside-triphosphate reductase activating protein [unclassified Lacrimispora]|uniref:anaerobic ribonucleoside-triphosphate reductase activating protein n=1 Tax=unclassified Lacrimispora TaxID=2719232 RepID=UPI00376FC9EC